MTREKIISTFKSGDLVTAQNYGGVLEIQHLDKCLTFLTQTPHYFCIDTEYDTCFDTYSEDDLTLVEKETK